MLRVRRRHHRPHAQSLILAIAVGAGACFASAPAVSAPYGPATVKRMTDGSLRLSPAALRSLLLGCRKDLDRGVKEAMETVGDLPKGKAVEALASEMALLPTLPETGTPVPVIAYHFGRIAGLLFALNDSLHAPGDHRARSVTSDYAAYVERKLPRMVLAFDGYTNPVFDGDVKGYMRQRITREARYRKAVVETYFPGGSRVSSRTFDDRSNAFGVAQVTLSHAVSDTAKFWFHAWRAMDGDISATPYYRPRGAKSAPGKMTADRPGDRPPDGRRRQ